MIRREFARRPLTNYHTIGGGKKVWAIVLLWVITYDQSPHFHAPFNTYLLRFPPFLSSHPNYHGDLVCVCEEEIESI